MTYEYEKTVEHKGITGYKFSMGKKTLSNDTRRRYPHEQAKYFEPTTTTEDFFVVDPTTIRPEDEDDDPDVVNEGQCFCNGECAPQGVINITACRFGAPGFISLPHFHKGDPMLRNQFTGLNPNDDDHSFSITLEPVGCAFSICTSCIEQLLWTADVIAYAGNVILTCSMDNYDIYITCYIYI